MSKAKRILIINYEFPPLGGGGGVAAKKLALGFIEQGYQVDYVTSCFRDWKDKEIVDGINVYRVKVIGRKNLQTASLISLLTFPPAAFLKCVQLCLKNHYAFINSHFAVPSGVLGTAISKIFKLKHIVSLHGGDIYNPNNPLSPHRKWYYRQVVKRVLNNADRLVAQSSDTRNNATKIYQPKNETKVIPLPYIPIKFKKTVRQDLGMSPAKTYLIAVGRLVKRKGFDYLIRSLALLEENIEALILGRGPEMANLLNLTQELKLENRVHLLGNKNEEKKFQYLSCADLYVLSSLHEGFGIVLQEAMQVGLPIVATNYGGQTDILKEGENALLVPPKDPRALAQRIKELLEKEPLRQKMRTNNQHKVEEFATSKIANEYLKLASFSWEKKEETTENKEVAWKSMQKDHYENLANHFDTTQRRENRNHVNKVLAISEFLDIRENERVLEVGVGTGIHAQYLLDINGEKFQFTGVDLSKSMLSKAKERLSAYKNIVLKEMDGENLEFGDEVFNKIYMSGSLHHFLNPAKGISELTRVLKTGGKFCIVEPNYIFPTNFYSAYKSPTEKNMRWIRKGNFRRCLKGLKVKEYRIENFAYTPPFPKLLIPFFDKLDKALNRIPIIRNFSVMLFVHGTK